MMKDRCTSWANSHQCMLARGHAYAHDFLDVAAAIDILRPKLAELGTTIDRCRFYHFDLVHDAAIYADVGGMTKDTDYPWMRMLYTHATGWVAHTGRLKF